MMTNMTARFTDESRASPNDNDGLTKRRVFNGDNHAIGMRRQQSGSVVMIWGGMVGNELSSLFRVPEELYCPLTFIARS